MRFQYKDCVGLMKKNLKEKNQYQRFQYKDCVGLIVDVLRQIADNVIFQYKDCVGLISLYRIYSLYLL